MNKQLKLSSRVYKDYEHDTMNNVPHIKPPTYVSYTNPRCD